MKPRISHGMLAGVLLLSGSSPALAETTIFEEIICRVNNDIITKSEYEEAANLLKLRVQGQKKLSGEQLAQAVSEGEKDLLKNMIEERLLVQKAVELGMTADTDVIKYLDRLRSENNLPSIEALEQTMRQQGINPVEFRKRIKGAEPQGAGPGARSLLPHSRFPPRRSRPSMRPTGTSSIGRSRCGSRRF